MKEGCLLCRTLTLCVITLSYDNLIPKRRTDGISCRSLSMVIWISASPNGPKAWLKSGAYLIIEKTACETPDIDWLIKLYSEIREGLISILKQGSDLRK